MQIVVEITPKEAFASHHNRSVINELEGVGLKGISSLKSSKLYRLEGEITEQDALAIGDEVLRDSVLEDSFISVLPDDADFVVEVWLKESATDVVAETVEKAISISSFGKQVRVRTANKYAVSGSFTEDELQKAVNRSLSNGVVNKTIIQHK